MINRLLLLLILQQKVLIMTKKKYTTKENSPRCPRCGQAFPSSSILQNHINQPVSACRHIHENVMHFRTLESPTREYPSLNTPLPISRDGSPVANDSMDVDQPPGPSSEDDIPPKPAKYKYLYERQDFPGTAAIIGKGKTFMDNFAEDHYQHERELNLYYPFATREEWELSLFLLCSGLSVAAIDDFLQLEMVGNSVQCFNLELSPYRSKGSTSRTNQQKVYGIVPKCFLQVQSGKVKNSNQHIPPKTNSPYFIATQWSVLRPFSSALYSKTVSVLLHSNCLRNVTR